MSDAPDTSLDSPAAPPVFPLVAYLDGMMEELRGRIPVALDEWDADSIHQSRVATRRMKAALDLMKPVLSKRRRRGVGRIFRKLRRRLGPLRDGDVMLGHLHEFAADGKHAIAVGWLSSRLMAQREGLRQRSATQSPAAKVLAKLSSWSPVREEMLDSREAGDSLIAESLHLQLDMFAEQADRLNGPKAPDEAERQDPHELRISGKALRYTLEMAVVQGHDLPGSLTKTFKKMQEALGLWHDYVVLSDCAIQTALDEQLGHHEPELMNAVLDLVRDVLNEATDDLGTFKRLWSKEGEVIAKAIRTTFPLTRAKFSESGMDRGLSDSGSPEAGEDVPPVEPSTA